MSLLVFSVSLCFLVLVALAHGHRGSAFFVRHHYTLMKNTITITSSLLGLLTLLFILDVSYLHAFGLRLEQFSQHPDVPGVLFWMGFALSFLATVLAATGLRGHWRSGSVVGLFILCLAILASFFWFITYVSVTHNSFQ
jgi:hypothetical protein